MASPVYTVLIVPERSAKVHRYKVSYQWLVRAAVSGIVLLALGLFFVVHYAYLIHEAGHNHTLEDENIALKNRLHEIQNELVRMDATVQRIEQFSVRIRGMTQLHDPERNLTMGPLSYETNNKSAQVLYANGERIDYEDENLDSKLALRLINSNLEQVHNATNHTEETVRQLRDYFVEHDILLATTPSIRPTKSRLMTSAFGIRVDPYTNREVMHKGLDFAAEQGAEVLAPADGRVVFAGNRGNGYGQTLVLEHGFGVQTHYAHLADFRVQVGALVHRGDVIGAVGNTGRSTVAHLHYEVRFQGIPQDPEQFILN